jgi:hypothetical protein
MDAVRKILDELRNSFRDAARQFPLLFAARIVGEPIPLDEWPKLVGAQNFTGYHYGSSRNGSQIVACFFSAADRDSFMAKQGYSEYIRLGEISRTAIQQVPHEVLACVIPDTESQHSLSNDWTNYVVQSCKFEPMGMGRCRCEQFYVLENEVTPGQYGMVPVTAYKHSPAMFGALKFPNSMLELLSGDIFTASSLAIDKVSSKLPDFHVGFWIAHWKSDSEGNVSLLAYDKASIDEFSERYGRPYSIFENPGVKASLPILVNELDRLPTGKRDAHTYQRLVFDILSNVFSSELANGKMEQSINDGRKRIDVVFDNVANAGFFDDLARRHQIKCPLIHIECKNYSKDVSNPEIDQLLGRLNHLRGNFGILVCRAVTDEVTLRNRCRDAMRDGKCVLVLCDDDLRFLAQFKQASNQSGIDNLLRGKLRALLL